MLLPSLIAVSSATHYVFGVYGSLIPPLNKSHLSPEMIIMLFSVVCGDFRTPAFLSFQEYNGGRLREPNKYVCSFKFQVVVRVF